MSNKLASYGYKISYESMTDNMSSELVGNLEKGHSIALKGKQEGLKQLKKLIDRYPNVPQFKNYLTVWYQVRGNLQKAREVNKKTLQKHPDYLYAKVNLAHEYLDNKQPEKVVELLGEGIEIKQMHPEREEFHITEVIPVLKVAIKYFIVTKDFEQAEIRLNMLKELDWLDEKEIEKYETTLMFSKIADSPFLNREESMFRVETKPQPQTTKLIPPVFHHQEIYELYEAKNFTENEILKFLELPRKTLIQDLETALKDSFERFTFFDEDTADFREVNFVLYSLMLLKELKAEESLPVILEVLAQSNEYIEIYFNDFITEYVWEVIFELGKNHFDLLSDFMKKPYVYTYSKTAVSEAIAQSAIHYPEKRKEVVDWFAELFKFYAQSEADKGIIDEAVISSLICDAIDFCGKELKDDIKIMFEKGCVDETFCGDWKDVSEELDNASQERKKENFTEIAKNLKYLSKVENDDFDDSEEYTDSEEIEEKTSSGIVSNKKDIGRNDPCFCGSGKKYKKCCLNK